MAVFVAGEDDVDLNDRTTTRNDRKTPKLLRRRSPPPLLRFVEEAFFATVVDAFVDTDGTATSVSSSPRSAKKEGRRLRFILFFRWIMGKRSSIGVYLFLDHSSLYHWEIKKSEQSRRFRWAEVRRRFLWVRERVRYPRRSICPLALPRIVLGLGVPFARAVRYRLTPSPLPFRPPLHRNDVM